MKCPVNNVRYKVNGVAYNQVVKFKGNFLEPVHDFRPLTNFKGIKIPQTGNSKQSLREISRWRKLYCDFYPLSPGEEGTCDPAPHYESREGFQMGPLREHVFVA